MPTSEFKIRIPVEMAESVRAITKARESTINEYVQRAIRLQLLADGTGANADTLTKLIQNANTPLTESANFASVHAAATLAFLREFARLVFQEQGLPEHLAQEKAEMLAENALAEATNTFENPQNRVQFGWVERFDEETLALFMEDDDGDDE